MSAERNNRRLAVLAIAGLAGVVLSALAVDILGDVAVGALLGVLVVLVVLGLRQQSRYARRSAADLAAASRALASMDRRVDKVTKEVTALSTTVTKWSQDVKVAEIETGIAALNRYVALGSDDTVHEA